MIGIWQCKGKSAPGLSWPDAVLLLVCVAGVSVVRLRDGE
jgi:hypothetical protein